MRLALLALAVLCTGCVSEIEAFLEQRIPDPVSDDRMVHCYREMREYGRDVRTFAVEMVEEHRANPEAPVTIPRLKRPAGYAGRREHQEFREWLATKPPKEWVEERLHQQCFREDVSILLTGDKYGAIRYQGIDGPWDDRAAWWNEDYLVACSFDKRRDPLPLRFCEVLFTHELKKGSLLPGAVPPKLDPDVAKRYYQGVRREPGDE